MTKANAKPSATPKRPLWYFILVILSGARPLLPQPANFRLALSVFRVQLIWSLLLTVDLAAQDNVIIRYCPGTDGNHVGHTERFQAAEQNGQAQ